MTTIDEKKLQQQIDLEKEQVALGRQRYMERVDSLAERGDGDRTRPSMDILHRLLDVLTEGIEANRQSEADRIAKSGGHKHRPVVLTEDIEPKNLAYITLRKALSNVAKDMTMSSAAISVGSAVLEELQLQTWREVDPEYYDNTMKLVARHRLAGSKRKAARGIQRFRDVELPKWSTEDKAQVGMALLQILISTTGLWHSPIKRQGRRTIRFFLPTAELVRWLEEAHDRLSLLTPVRLPMVVPPVDWETPHDGGYLTNLGGPVKLVKTRNKGYLRSLEQIDMPEVYEAINAMQSTAWQVNRRVLDVAKTLWRQGATVGATGHESLPPREPQEIPPMPAEWENRVKEWRETDIEGYKVWAGRAAAVHESNDRCVSKRVAAAETLGIAERFLDEDAIYYPHQLDFRGRAYPVPSHLSPQGSDLSRGLLQFAEAKPIGERGIWWLKVHLANCFGIDKVSFADRVAWVDEHHDALLLSAIDPLEAGSIWLDADAPFQALAACMELARCAAGGPETLTQLPIAMDGSCNGLQNFSALLLDEVGGAATNLLPAGQPADIYSEVARLVAQRIQQEAEAGNPMAAQWDGHINRSLVKQPVMTLPYGATKAGMRQQIEDAVRRCGNPMGITTKRMWKTTGYLAGIVYDSIGEIVIAARSAMDWLQEAAGVVSSNKLPIYWTAPSGFPVLQQYRKLEGKKVQVHFNGQRIGVNVTRETTLDPRRQKAGISPNFVHSLDASHMMLTVNLCRANGINSFAMIHDSYGCHASDVDLLHTALRQAFVDMYSSDLLMHFADELGEQLPDELAAKLPELPAKGSLDLAQVHESPYFFA